MKSISGLVKTFIVLALVSIIAVYATLTFAIELSSFGIGIAKYAMAILVVYFVDRFAFGEVKTLDLIQKDPIAYAIFFLANCILAASCISAS